MAMRPETSSDAGGASSSAPLLRAQQLVRTAGERRVVDVPLVELRRGEVLVVLGPNGAGKSTLMRLLLFLQEADSGTIAFDGSPARPGDPAPRRAIAAMLQQPRLFSGTVGDNVVYGLRTRRVARAEARQRARRVLDELEIGHLADADVRSLSGGEAQRVALARALVVEPLVLGLDEPTAGLDAMVRRAFHQALERSMRAHAAGCILVTHDPAEAFLLADRILVMEEGRVVQEGTPDQLVMEPRTPFVASFTGAELLLDGVVCAQSDGTVQVQLEHGGVVTATHTAGASLEPGCRAHVAYRPEDVVLARTGAGEQTSARNSLCCTIESLSPVGGLIRVRLGGAPALVAHVTRPAAEALQLAPGGSVRALLKATALRAFPAAARVQRPVPR